MANPFFRPLAGTGAVRYNGFDIPNPFQARVTSTPIKDSSGRTNKYIQYNLTLDFIVTEEDFSTPYNWQGGFGLGDNFDSGSLERDVRLSGDPNYSVDSPMEWLRGILGTPGRPLEFLGQGLGNDLTFTYRNVMNFGPHPKISLWEPIGSSRTVHIVLDITWTTTEILPGSPGVKVKIGPDAAGEFNYDILFGINQEGLCTRTITGIIESHIPRNPDTRRIHNTADRWRDYLRIPMLSGFKRDQSWVLSRDRRFLNFSITDTEIPGQNAYASKMVDMQVTQTVSARFVRAMKTMAIDQLSKKADIVISGSITVAPGQKKSLAWMAFKHIVHSKRSHFKNAQHPTDVDDEGKPTPGTELAWMDLRITDGIFDNTVSFSLSWQVITSLDTLIQGTGLFQPLVSSPSASWNNWTTSMIRGKTYHPRGHVGLYHDSSKETVVDFGGGTLPNLEASLKKPKKETKKKDPIKDPIVDDEKPSEQESFLAFDLRMSLERDSSVLTHYPLGYKDSESKTTGNLGGGGFKVAGTGPNPKAKVQHRGVGRYRLTVYGFAKRKAHPIKMEDVGEITSVNGETPILEKEVVLLQRNCGMSGRWPVQEMVFVKTYLVTSAEIGDFKYSAPKNALGITDAKGGTV